MKFPRRFNIDLQPKFVYSVGDVVDWTVNCGVSLYLEFKPLEAGVIWDRNGIRRVPCNKSEIFANEALSVVEKRLLMKFIEFCSKSIEEGNFDVNVRFVDVMIEKKLPQHLQNILLYAILLIEDVNVSFAEALSRMEKYVSSLGIYKDNCALLYPMYGSSDIPQGFCRMCAVYEGTYVITDELAIEDVCEIDGLQVVTSSFGPLRAKKVFLNSVYASLDKQVNIEIETSSFRAAILCRGIIKESEGPVLFSIPPMEFGNTSVVYVLQLGESSSTVPAGYSMLHVWTAEGNVDIIQSFIASVPVEIVFLATYKHTVVRCSGTLNHVYNPGGYEILKHFVRYIQVHAKEIFQKEKGNHEFLPLRHTEEEDVLKDI